MLIYIPYVFHHLDEWGDEGVRILIIAICIALTGLGMWGDSAVSGSGDAET